jgi:hypothetical protein
MRTDGQTDRHEEDNSRSTQIANAPKIGVGVDLIYKVAQCICSDILLL